LLKSIIYIWNSFIITKIFLETFGNHCLSGFENKSLRDFKEQLEYLVKGIKMNVVGETFL